jgi:hypothetical protein
MNNFKLVIFDYPKLQLENPMAQKVLNDLIITKQQNFVRTDPNYVVVDKHDMVGTHYLIYDTTNLFNPRLIFALRTTYEERAKTHKIRTPMQDLAPLLQGNCKQAYEAFRGRHDLLVDCNSWFVDPEFSLKKSGLRLSDVGYAMVYLQLTRMGYDHFVGCTNEKYKAHRWIENIGSFPKGYEFIHPVVTDNHMLIMLESFNHTYLDSIYQSHKDLFDQLLEICPAKCGYKTISETINDQFGKMAEVSYLADKKAG